MLNETTIIEWFLVTFSDAPSPNKILWGIIYNDPSGRWLQGDYTCTSPVLKKRDDNTYITKNTQYHVIGPGQEIQLPVKAILDLRMGYSPIEWLANTIPESPPTLDQKAKTLNV